MKKEKLIKQFNHIYGSDPSSCYFAPGRINLIGEHTDYNGGHSIPCAISLGIYGAFKKRSDRQVRLYSGNLKTAIVTFELGDTAKESGESAWANYFKGMLIYISEKHPIDYGFDLYVEADLPSGAGLSSSAAIEMLMGNILEQEYEIQISKIDTVKLGQRVENQFIGLNNGMMDQFAINFGRKDTAVMFDAVTLGYEYLPLKLGDYEIVIMSTNKPHNLIESKYNDRVAECEEAVKRLNQELQIDKLGELNNDQFDEYNYLLDDSILIKRARHAVSENQRCLRAKEAMKAGDLLELGRLIYASHMSLKYDYEVTGKELDTLVASAQAHGAIGARMIGGGFGGSAISLVKKAAAEEFKAAVAKDYLAAIGYEASFYDAEIVDGPHKI